MNILIIGFGHAGRNLHLPCIKKVLKNLSRSLTENKIYYYDPNVLQELSDLDPSVTALTEEKLLQLKDKDKLICHICTPPGEHLNALHKMAKIGIKKIIIEKPLATTVEDAHEILRIKFKYGLDVFVVAPWLSSKLTHDIKLILDEEKYGQLVHFEMYQNKSRFSRAIVSKNENIFFIEMPHEISLALYLLGDNVSIDSLHAQPMMINSELYLKNMGSCSLILNHNDKYRSALHSKLNSPVWKRSVELYFSTGHRLIGYFPVNGSDNFSQLFIYDDQGVLTKRQIYNDDVLTNCLLEFYNYFINETIALQAPISTLLYNNKVVGIIDQAIKLMDGNPPVNSYTPVQSFSSNPLHNHYYYEVNYGG